MGITQPIIKCRSGANTTNTIVEVQINTNYDVSNEIWYKTDEDFKLNEWQNTLDINTDDGSISGAGRQATDITSFSENAEITFKEDYASSLLRRLHEETLQGDQHFMDLLQGGINIRFTTMLGLGQWTRKTYNCCSISDFNKPFEQLSNADSEVTFKLVLNYEPQCDNVGVGVDLPNSIKQVSVTETINIVDADISVTLDNVIDEDNLIVQTNPVGNEWNVTIYDSNGQIVNSLNGASNMPFAFTGLITGTYTAVVSYCYLVDNSNNYYSSVASKIFMVG